MCIHFQAATYNFCLLSFSLQLAWRYMAPAFFRDHVFSVFCVSFFLPMCCTSLSMHTKVVDSIQTG